MEKKRFVISSQPLGDLESLVHPIFTRCDYFTVVTVIENEIKVEKIVVNKAKRAMSGAEIIAVRTIIKLGADLVITGNVRYNELELFQQIGILVAVSGITKVKIAVKNYLEGNLPVIPVSNLNHGTGRVIGMDLELETNEIQESDIKLGKVIDDYIRPQY